MHDFLSTRLQVLIGVLDGVISFISSDEEVVVRRLHKSCWMLLNHSFLANEERRDLHVGGHTLAMGEVGRPRIEINFEYIELLQEAGYTLEEASQALQVSRTTLWRRMSEVEMVWRRSSDISDHDLDLVVVKLQQQYPNCGQSLLQGHLRSRQIFIPRH